MTPAPKSGYDSHMLDFTPMSIIGAFLFSVVGIVAFKRGKQNLNYRLLFVGMGLMGYSIFTSGPWQTWLVGLALSGGAYYFWSN